MKKSQNHLDVGQRGKTRYTERDSTHGAGYDWLCWKRELKGMVFGEARRVESPEGENRFWREMFEDGAERLDAHKAPSTGAEPGS